MRSGRHRLGLDRLGLHRLGRTRQPLEPLLASTLGDWQDIDVVLGGEDAEIVNIMRPPAAS
jgi:hypothetical protein